MKEREGTTKSHAARLRKILPILLPIVILIGISAALYATFGRELLTMVKEPQIFKAWLDGFGAWGEVVFVFLRITQVAFKYLPSEPFEVASGYAFGVWGGLLWCTVGTQIGSVIVLLLTRKFGMRFVARFIDPERLTGFSFLKQKTRRRTLLFIIYLIPGAPKDILTYFVGLTDIRVSEYLLISTVARIPSIITSTICGAYFGEKNYLAAILVYGVTLLMTAVGVVLYRYIQKKQSAAASNTD